MAQGRKKRTTGKARSPAKKARAARRSSAQPAEPVKDYRHDEKRKNNSEAGLVTYERVAERPPPKQYEYDPHLDPQLVWAGKAEHTSSQVDTLTPHIHSDSLVANSLTDWQGAM